MGGRLSSGKDRAAEVEMALTKAQEIVASNPVVVFSKTYCPYCTTAKKLLTQLGASYEAIEIDVEDDGIDIQEALAGWTGQRTVPNIFINSDHIGGCDTLTGMHNDGELVPLLTEAGALTT